jgi:integrase
MALVKIQGVKTYTSKGRTYAYHRSSGVALKTRIGSPEFLAELAKVDEEYRAKHTAAVSHKPGTWGGLVAAYREHRMPELAKRTRHDYERILNWTANLKDMPLADWSRGFVIKMRDKALAQHKRRFANYVVAVVQAVFSWGLDRDYITENPVKRIKSIKRPKNMARANRPWTKAEWDVAVAEAPPHLLAPILLCGVLGWRRGEVVSRPRSDYDSEAKKIRRVSAKSGKVVKTTVPKAIHDALDALLPHDAVTLLVNTRGRPWTIDGFATSMFTFLRKLESEGRVGPGLTMHGLRHTCGTTMRELGFDLQTIADMLGQEQAGMAGWYSRDAELEGKLAGVVDKLDEHMK